MPSEQTTREQRLTDLAQETERLGLYDGKPWPGRVPTDAPQPAEVLRDCLARYSGMKVSVYDARVILRWMAEAGLAVVSREPTSDMIDAGIRERQDNGGGVTEVWAAMVEAANAR